MTLLLTRRGGWDGRQVVLKRPGVGEFLIEQHRDDLFRGLL
jgi:hypothetical protein